MRYIFARCAKFGGSAMYLCFLVITMRNELSVLVEMSSEFECVINTPALSLSLKTAGYISCFEVLNATHTSSSACPPLFVCLTLNATHTSSHTSSRIQCHTHQLICVSFFVCIHRIPDITRDLFIILYTYIHTYIHT